jgi:small subunit ribosomal protein S2
MAEETIVKDNQTPVYPAGETNEASREMIAAGVFYGRKKSKTNPKMRGFIIANRTGIEVINLEKTEESLARAAGFVTEKVRNGGFGLFVATQPAAETSVVATAKKFDMPYVSTRWVGGTVTNFKIISARVEHLKKLRGDLASGALDKYTKKERVEIDREIHRLEELMGGLEMMPKEPDFLLIIDPTLHSTAVREARVKRIPIVAFANIDADPDVIDYLVPGNDKSKKSIEWFLEKMAAAIESGIKLRVAAVSKEETSKA